MQAGARRARVLWVSEEPPDRTLGGGNIRQSHLFEALASVIPTDLLVSTPVRDQGVRSIAAQVVELSPHSMPSSTHPVGRRMLELAILLGSRYPVSLFSAAANRRALADAIHDREQLYELVLVEHEALAPLLPRTRKAIWVITFHHVLSAMIAEDLRLAPGRRQRWFRSRDLEKARRLERGALDGYDHSIVCSDDDRTRLSSAGGRPPDRTTVIPNGVDLEVLRPSPIPASPRVLLPGTLCWPPNVDAAVWLCNEVWPQVRAAVPEATLVLAGRAPTAEVIELGQLGGVSVKGDVPSMVPEFEEARVVAVPLRVGTGTRLKALEAMAAGRPVVGTAVGLEGIGIEDRVHARVADSAEQFAGAVVEMLRDDATAGALASAARAHVERHFGWERIGGEFVALIRALLDGAGEAHAAPRSASRLA